MPTILEELMEDAHRIADDPVDGLKNLRALMEDVQEQLRQKQAQNKRKNEEPKFVQPKKTNKAQKTTPKPPPIPTHNSFEPLNNPGCSNQMDHESIPNNTPETTKEETTTQTTKPSEQKKYTIPPIYLKDKDKWMNVSRMIKEKNIATTKCKLVNTGVQIDASTEEDYMKIKSVLKTNNLQYYTFQPKSEKPIKAVFRGVPQEISEEEVRNDLLLRNYPATKVKRMNGRDGKPSPLVFIELPEQYRSIFNIKTCCGLDIKVEQKNPRRNVIQCHKCQMYGHIQRHCNVNHRCMKCGGEHSTHNCEKPKTTPPKCANCNGEHISTFLHCEKNPNNPKNRKTPAVAEPPTENAWKKRQEEREKKMREREERQPTTNCEDALAVILGQMLIILNATNATIEQKMQFFQQTEAITALFAQRH